MKVAIKRFDKKIKLPNYEKGAAGCDLTCRKGATIKPGEIVAVAAGIAIQVPAGYVALIFPRSSTASRKGLLLANSIGVIDPFYSGDDNEIMLLFYNFTQQNVSVKKGEKLVQCLLIKNETIEREEKNSFKQSTRPTREKKPGAKV